MLFPKPRESVPRALVEVENLSGVSELREPVSASLGPREENLVAWSGSLRIHVDVHNQFPLLGRLVKLPVAGPVQQRRSRVILDILAGAQGMQATECGKCPRGFEAKGVQHLPAKVLGHVR